MINDINAAANIPNSIPDVFILSGKAAVLRERISFTETTDPPFYAAMAISKESVEVGLGTNYQMPQGSGSFLDLKAQAEIAYFFADPKAWYINVGRELPEEKRIKARIFSLIDGWAYLMISSGGIRASEENKQVNELKQAA